MGNIDATFNASLQRTLGNRSFNSDFIEHFYEHLIGQSDEIAALFRHTDMSVQKTMLHDSLQLMVDYYRSRELPIGLQRIAQMHGRKGRAIPERMYATWLDSLMQALQRFDPQFSDEVELAWRETLAPGIAYMQSQY